MRVLSGANSSFCWPGDAELSASDSLRASHCNLLARDRVQSRGKNEADIAPDN